MVWLVVMTAPNGNKLSRVLVAETPMDAQEMFAAMDDIDTADESFRWEITQRQDLDGSYERALVDAERRRLENEYYKMPAKKMPWSGNRRRG